MKINKIISLFAFAIVCSVLLSCSSDKIKDEEITKNETIQADPLPSWNNVSSKKTIIDFVNEVTNTKSENYIAISDRVATFDNDGTLWSEQPLYFQFLFAMDRIQKLAPENPEWNNNPLFKAAIENDFNGVMKSGVPGILTLTMASHSGLTSTEFEIIVKDWISKARHPKTNQLYKDMVYQPMLEVLGYLRSAGFKTYIVSGGGIDFMRPWAEVVYGIPPEQIIGSSLKLEFQMVDGVPYLIKQDEIDFINDKETKPVGIHKFIGKKPVAAFGNSDGDLQMLQWTASYSGKALMVYIHHTDNEREWAYDRESHIGKLDKGWDEALEKGWTIVDMKNDWKVVYPFELTNR